MENIKKQFKEKIKLEKDYKSPIKWIVDVKFGSGKDNKFKKELTDYMILIADGIWNEAKSQYETILNNASKGYIKVENIPAYEDIFGSIQDMISSNENSIKDSKEELVKLTKQKEKLKTYDEIREKESEIFWAKHRLENYEGEIRFLENMKGKIIREAHWKFKEGKNNGNKTR